MPLRVAVAYGLLAAIVSLVLVQERLPDREEARDPAAPDSLVISREPAGWLNVMRSTRMELEDPTATVLAGPKAGKTDSLDAGVPVAPLLPTDRSLQDPQSDMTSLIEKGVKQVEHVIQLYPWPTVLIGMALGFFIARRVR